MNALVTGGTGFVGGHLVEALLQAGDTVTLLIRSPQKAAGLEQRGARLIRGDLADPVALREAASRQDVIYHCAGLVAARSEREFLAVNRDGTAQLLAAAREVSGARIVLVSSLAAAGPAARGARHSGHEAPHPVTAYGRSKLAGEELLRNGTLAWTILRPPAVYGPRDTEMLRVFKAVRFGVVPVFGDGSQELSLVYAPDLAEAILAAGHCEAAAGRIFYPCHPEVLTSRVFIGTVGEAMGKRPRVVPLSQGLAAAALAVVSSAARLTGRATVLTPDKAHEFFALAWTADPGPLRNATGWSASHDFASGAEATAAWYRAAGWL